MNSNRKIAIDYLKLGLNPVPTKRTKEPIRPKFTTSLITEQEITKYSFTCIGVATGFTSGNLEAIDFDIKNSNEPDMVMVNFKKNVRKELLDKLVVQKTISGGYHIIYRCKTIESNQKLALNETGEAIIETRGEGGYIQCPPTDGYRFLHNDFTKIPLITKEEREELFISAKIQDKGINKRVEKRRSKQDKDFLEIFPDYNNDSEIGINLLLEHGWVEHSRDKDYVNFTRPNSKSGGLHGGYNLTGKFFYAFSTAQSSFETGRAYNNHAILAELQYKGDYQSAYQQLKHEGYEYKEQPKVKVKETWDQEVEKLEFLSDEFEENEYLHAARKGNIKQGLSTGWSMLDTYFRIKPNSFNMGIGYDGTGKSLFMLSLATATNVLHGWKWGMVMPENKTAMSRRRLIEAKTGTPIIKFMDQSETFNNLLKESRNNFKIISNKKHYSIKDVIDMGIKLYEVYGINALLIDPYNFFKVQGNGYTHNNEILSELRVFAEKYCSVYVMAHPNSDATRMNKDNDGYLKPPTKYQIQGGADFPYRVDDFFVTHRIGNHVDLDVRRTMQFIMEKVKEEETGGMKHPKDHYTELIFEKRDNFLGYWDSKGNNPMYKAKTSSDNVVKYLSPEEAFG